MKIPLASVSLALFFFLMPQPGKTQAGLQEFATGLTRPVAITSAGDNRLFVVEQPGTIRIVDTAGQVMEQPFLDIPDRVISTGNEQGLLGLAFHPDYAANGYFYVNYTDINGNTVVSRFSVQPDDPDQADPESEYILITVDQPFSNHNGGDIKFGPDGYLYTGLGDGGSAGDPQDNAQDLAVMLGKMLRIDVDGGEPYAIPATNPFIGDPAALDEIWAFGLRNPWRFSFDRETGDLWIADVGQALLEEINRQESGSNGGENYGWRCYEGTGAYNTEGCPPDEQFTFPVYEYAHDPGAHCSVTGGYVYRGEMYPGLRGLYFFADYCSGALWSLHDEGDGWMVENQGVFPGSRFTTFGEDHRGELYLADLDAGTVFRVISDTGNSTGDDIRASRYSIWPNPAGEMLWIEPRSSGGMPVHATLYGPGGRELIKAGPFTGRFSLDLKEMPAGIYALSLVTTSGEEVQLIVRE